MTLNAISNLGKPIDPKDVIAKPCGLETKGESSQSPSSNYYADTITSANDELPAVLNPQQIEENTKIVEEKLNAISSELDELLKRNDIDFEKLQNKIYRVIMLLMRIAAKNDHEYITEMNDQIKAQAVKIQGTYNTWPGLTFTLVSAGVGCFGGLAGLSPLLPESVINPATASVLASSAQSVGTAGTGLSGIASVFNSRGEAVRGVWHIDLKRMQDKGEDKKGAEHSNNEARKAAKVASEQFNQTVHDAAKSITG